MTIRSFLFALMSLSTVILAVSLGMPEVAADSVSIVADQNVYALGETIGMTVSYMGGVHGDIKLSLEDVWGNIINEWTWSHANSDPFQQSVSYTPMNPGTYMIRALHQPHHMEPPASASTQVAVWSAKIVNLEYSSTVDAGKPVDISAIVDYYFTQATQVKLELWSNSENKKMATLTESMNGQGRSTLTLTNVVFEMAQTQDLTAQISYMSPSGKWKSDAQGSSYSSKVTVVPEFYVAPALILLVALLNIGVLSKHLAGKHVT